MGYQEGRGAAILTDKSLRDLLAAPLIRALAGPFTVHHMGLHGLAACRQLPQRGGVEVAIDRERKRARDRRGGEVQRVHGHPPRCLGIERCALADPEAVLLVDHA